MTALKLRPKGVSLASSLRALLAVSALPLFLAACDTVDDTYDYLTDGMWGGSSSSGPTTVDGGTSGAYPNLATVPDARPEATPEEVRDQTAEGLANDKNNAQYDQTLTPDNTAGAAAPPPPAAVPETAAAPATTSSTAPAQPPLTASGGTTTAPAPAPASPPPAPATASTTPSAPATTQVATAPKTTTSVIPTQGAVGGGRVQLVGVIYFAHGSAALDGRDMVVLKEIAKLHGQYGGVVRVIGHASARTGLMNAADYEVANLTISLDRADAVTQALASMGVQRAELISEGRSDQQPVYHEFMPTGEAGNRRAEIYLEY